MNITEKWFYYNNVLVNVEKVNSNTDSLFKGVYDVLRVYNGKPLFLKEHLDRLANSLLKLNRHVSIDYQNIEKKIFELIRINNVSDGNIRVQYSNINNSEFQLICFVPHKYPDSNLYSTGIKVISFAIERVNPQIKQSEINSYIRKQVADIKKEKNAYEVVLINRDEQITEGSKSNIIFVSDCTLYTAPKKQILEGITRKVVLDLAIKNNYKVIEMPIYLNQLNQFDGCFITGTSPKILPIAQFDELYFNPRHKTIQKLLYEFNALICS